MLHNNTTEIDIKGLDKAEILTGLYNYGSFPSFQGAGLYSQLVLKTKSDNKMTNEHAGMIIEQALSKAERGVKS